MRTRFCLLIALCIANSEPDLSSKVALYMQAQVKVNGFVGSVLVAQNGQVLVSRSFGPAGTVLAPSTRYRVGSIATQFTDIAILQLQERGALLLEDSVCKHIKECPDDWRPITLFDLMTHRSGISEIPSTSTDSRSNASVSDVPDRLSKVKQGRVRFKVGESVEWSYAEDEVL